MTKSHLVPHVTKLNLKPQYAEDSWQVKAWKEMYRKIGHRDVGRKGLKHSKFYQFKMTIQPNSIASTLPHQQPTIAAPLDPVQTPNQALGLLQKPPEPLQGAQWLKYCFFK